MGTFLTKQLVKFFSGASQYSHIQQPVIKKPSKISHAMYGESI